MKVLIELTAPKVADAQSARERNAQSGQLARALKIIASRFENAGVADLEINETTVRAAVRVEA